MARRLPEVVLVGRMNAGKSTLYNKLAEQSAVLVSDVPGTTRDLHRAHISWRGSDFVLIDTGGLDAAIQGPIEHEVQRHAYRAVERADLIVFVGDGTLPVRSEDRLIARSIRRSKKPTILAVTKVDGPAKRRRVAPNFQNLGLGQPHLVSGVSGVGTGDLLDVIVHHIPSRTYQAPTTDITVSIIGKTNVGKSSLFNAILGEERVIVTPLPHTTREPNDTTITFKDKTIILVDTAGLRRDRKQTDKLEQHSADKTKWMIQHSDISWVVTDVSEPLSVQDQIIADHALRAGNGMVLVGNKWDLIKDKNPRAIREHRARYQRYFPALGWAPLIFTSAVDKQRLHVLLQQTIAIAEMRQRRMTEAELHQLILQNPPKKALPSKGTKSATHLRLEQTGIRPPRFTLFAKHAELINPAFCNYLEKELRKRYDYAGTEVRINLHKKHV